MDIFVNRFKQRAIIDLFQDFPAVDQRWISGTFSEREKTTQLSLARGL